MFSPEWAINKYLLHECKPLRNSGHVRWEEVAESGVFLVTHDKDKHIPSLTYFYFVQLIYLTITKWLWLLKVDEVSLSQDTLTWLSSFWPAPFSFNIYIKAIVGSILNIICVLKWIFGGKVIQLSCVDRKNMNTHIYKGKILRELMSIMQVLLINAICLTLGSDWYFSIYKPLCINLYKLVSDVLKLWMRYFNIWSVTFSSSKWQSWQWNKLLILLHLYTCQFSGELRYFIGSWKLISHIFFL